MKMNHVQDVTRLLAEGLKVGEPTTHGPLTLLPIHGAEPAGEYLLAAEAIDQGQLEISEVGGGSVPQLRATNLSSKPILILDGEHLEGAMQDRVLNTTVLLGTQAKTLLPVSCVEAGRWQYEGGEHFAASADHSYARLRHANIESVSVSMRSGMGPRSDQGRVWDEVASKQAEIGVDASPTSAMRDAYASKRQDLDDMIPGFNRPDGGQTGVGAVIGGAPAVVDIFDKPETLERLWTRLVRAYAMDALVPASKTRESGVEDFLVTASGADKSSHESVGLGVDVILSSDAVIGKALLWDGVVVHLSLFPRDEVGDDVNPRTGRIDGPSRRSNRRIY
jgi:hypothetical protein